MAGLPIVAGGPGVSAMALSRRGSGRALTPPSSPHHAAHSRSAAKLAARQHLVRAGTLETQAVATAGTGMGGQLMLGGFG